MKMTESAAYRLHQVLGLREKFLAAEKVAFEAADQTVLVRSNEDEPATEPMFKLMKLGEIREAISELDRQARALAGR